jgi:hypothetical protein
VGWLLIAIGAEEAEELEESGGDVDLDLDLDNGLSRDLVRSLSRSLDRERDLDLARSIFSRPVLENLAFLMVSRDDESCFSILGASIRSLSLRVREVRLPGDIARFGSTSSSSSLMIVGADLSGEIVISFGDFFSSSNCCCSLLLLVLLRVGEESGGLVELFATLGDAPPREALRISCATTASILSSERASRSDC